MKTNTIRVFGRRFDYWFEKTNRVWYAAEKDDTNHQIGDTLDAAHKDTLLVLIGAEAANERNSKTSRPTLESQTS